MKSDLCTKGSVCDLGGKILSLIDGGRRRIGSILSLCRSVGGALGEIAIRGRVGGAVDERRRAIARPRER